MRYLSLSRAARLAGITRAELQARIRRGEVATFEGSVAVNDLLRLYPSISLRDDDAFQRVERIKADAQPKLNTTAGETALPDPQVLMSRLHGLSQTLASQVSHLEAHKQLLDQVAERLDAFAGAPDDSLARRASDTCGWLRAARAELAADATTSAQSQLYARDTFLRIMAANVKLIPSGHDFFVEGNETILDASVRAGLNLSYGCSSGNCGNCKARVLSGETWKIRDHDYVISEREKAMNYILTCSHTAITDLVIEAAEALSVADLPQQQIRASLRKLERLSPEVMMLNVQTPRTGTLRFMAGQRALLTLEDGASRELPIASCPCNGRYLWFLVRRGDDAFSQAVFQHLRPGQLVCVEGPQGNFVLREDSPEPAVFVAFGDGIAPIKSLIEHAVSIDLIESFHLYWDTQYREGHHQAQWGRALRDSLDNFSFTPVISGNPRDVLALIQADLSKATAMRFYVAGPSNYVEPLIRLLAELGVPRDSIATEHTAS
ncbi:2Fe-2S iron-sulfur cluster binding domain-containing protein [Thiorhodococcus mannitoliphagus]|uniref:2Fe-2S iron-sulfur cluster binding domain-containing protein n=1 Tax=Thiorhodococcus mannitoliphagus TaxID=329406 RepID=A0A6P1DUK6_9GAMM|nr:2Fe-2S iron-sulfur cluster-binding protein [Thiorhodococcus mannitoliphagus]NEX21778.1 2Fe-2S iron-sulfur cluster binding domain-containing protein [Thiorhodococcus mannitoliphagus]